jgi:hypothetical protein
METYHRKVERRQLPSLQIMDITIVRDLEKAASQKNE